MSVSRRAELLAGSATLIGCPKKPTPDAGPAARDAGLGPVKALGADVPRPPTVVDGHCHSFNACDLPIYGFLMKVGRGMLLAKRMSNARLDGALHKLYSYCEQRQVPILRQPRHHDRVADDIRAAALERVAAHQCLGLKCLERARHAGGLDLFFL